MNMISRLQAKRSNTSAYPPARDGRTAYVIGDIHGRIDLLKQIHSSIDEDKLSTGTAQTVEIYLGDYVDRGPQVADVISALIRRANDTHAVFLRGNHEQLMLDFLEGRECLNQWKAVGALPSLLSYGLPAKLLSGEATQEQVRTALAQNLPQEHIDFLLDTGSYCTVESYLMVHAGIRPGVRLEDQQAADLFGIRGDFLDYEGDLGCIVVHGHTPVMEPDFRSNRINIDTGAFATNRLTCLRIGEDGARVLCFTEPNGKPRLGSRSDAYAVLGVDRNAEIRTTYVRLVKDLHPDTRSNHPFADEQLNAINSAYQDLSDLHRLSGPRQSDPGSFARRSAASFLISVTLVLAILGGLYSAGFFGPDPAATVMAPQQPLPQVTSVDGTSDQAADAAISAKVDDAMWAAAQREGTSQSLHHFIGRFSTGRHASQANAHLAIVAMSEEALRATPDGRDRAAIAEARTTLRRYLDIYPNGKLAAEVHTKLAAIEAAEAVVLADEAAWTHARRIGTREALFKYLSAYPHGLNQVEARTALVAIETAEARDRAERAAWTAAQEAGTEEAFRIYLGSHPNSNNAAAALQMLAALSAAEQERDQDDAAWVQAQQNNTEAAFSDYIATHPSGRHVQSARARLATLRAGEAKAPPIRGVQATKQAAPGEVKSVGPAALRWRSADEPFVGADGRIR